jgi:hypothetical protein
MERVPILVFAAVVAVIGMLAASSVYTERNDATMKTEGLQPRPSGITDRSPELA